MNISIVLPAYNEQPNVERTVLRTIEVVRPLFERFEIIIVDDASTDGTLQIARELALRHGEVRVIHNERNLGQGACQLLGFARARYELITHNGMDYCFDFNDLPKMLDMMKGADVVCAARTGRPGYTLYRRFISWVNRVLLRLLFPLRLSDYNFVQIYRKKVLDAINVRARSAGFVMPEILISAHSMGFRVKETPIEYHRREGGLASMGSPGVVLRSLLELFGLWWRRPPARRVQPLESAGKKTNCRN